MSGCSTRGQSSRRPTARGSRASCGEEGGLAGAGGGGDLARAPTPSCRRGRAARRRRSAGGSMRSIGSGPRRGGPRLTPGCGADDDEAEPGPQPRLRAGGGGGEQPGQARLVELDQREVVGLEVARPRRRVGAHDLPRVEAGDVAGPHRPSPAPTPGAALIVERDAWRCRGRAGRRRSVSGALDAAAAPRRTQGRKTRSASSAISLRAPSPARRRRRRPAGDAGARLDPGAPRAGSAGVAGGRDRGPAGAAQLRRGRARGAAANRALEAPPGAASARPALRARAS